MSYNLAQRCDFNIGDQVDGKYWVEGVLGEGTFGKVYYVKDSKGDVYALKLLRLWEVHPDLRQGLVDRFDMEFETGRIKSDYLVHSYFHGFAYGNPYIVMEYCGNGDLVSASKDKSTDYTYVAACILKGLRDLHASGKVHRDLKPENVLVKRNGVFALTDFGIAGDRNKRMTERNILGKPKQIFGTYAYMPPEQVKPAHRNSTVLPTTDIFSFGVVMYQLVTGSLPFGDLNDESDLPTYLRNAREGKWDRKKLKRSHANEWYKLIEGCLIPQLEQRVQTVTEALQLVPGYSPNESTIRGSNINFCTQIVNGIQLRVMQGYDYGKVFRLDDMMDEYRPIICLGRKDVDIKNDIELTENSSCYISRYHCTFELDYDIGEWIIRDGQWRIDKTGHWKRSTNGTFVNSTEASEHGIPFHPGDIISIGDVKLRAEAY